MDNPFKGYAESWMAGPEEIRTYIEENMEALDRYKACIEFAHRLIGEDTIHRISPASRLEYIKKRIKDDGLPKDDVDPHFVAHVMQNVYGVDTGSRPDIAFSALFVPFVTEGSRKAGHIDMDEEGRVMPTITEEEAAQMAEELGITPEMEEKMKEVFSMLAEGGMEALNEHYEREFFGFEGGYNVKDENLTRSLQAVAEAYKRHFGEPPKWGTYKCPLPGALLELCARTIDEETGRPMPDAKYLLDLKNTRPYIHEGDISLPVRTLTSDEAFIQCVLSELGHLISDSEPLGVEEFLKDQRGGFLKMSWDEGVGTRLSFAGMMNHYRERGTDVNEDLLAREYEISFCHTINVEHMLHPLALQQYSMRDAMAFAVYCDFSYPFGFHFLGRLSREDFRGLFGQKEPWKSPKLGWNREPGPESLSFMKTMVANKAAASFPLSMSNIEVGEAIMDAMKTWTRDFMKMQWSDLGQGP
jgi:hypothetical protein